MLDKCKMLNLLDLRTNGFDGAGNVMLRMSWSGQDSGLLLTIKLLEDVLGLSGSKKFEVTTSTLEDP